MLASYVHGQREIEHDYKYVLIQYRIRMFRLWRRITGSRPDSIDGRDVEKADDDHFLGRSRPSHVHGCTKPVDGSDQMWIVGGGREPRRCSSVRQFAGVLLSSRQFLNLLSGILQQF